MDGIWYFYRDRLLRDLRSRYDRSVEVLLPRGTGRRKGGRWLKARGRNVERTLLRGRKTHIFVACFQKSGSTYLTTLLSEITGFPCRAVVPGYGHNEQDISEAGLESLGRVNLVTQQHAKGTANNVTIMRKFGIRPVILVRNIFDVVVSLYDHIESGRHRMPTGYVHNEYWTMGTDAKLMYLIRVHLPWYFNFFMSWRESAKEMDALWVTYEELMANQVETVSRILAFYGLPVDHGTIHTAIAETARRPTRFNVGISGRGRGLSAVHRQAILDLAAVWGIEKKGMEIIGVSPATGFHTSEGGPR